MRGDIEAFTFAGAILEVESLLQIFFVEINLAQVVVGGTQNGVRSGEVRIKFDSVFEQWQLQLRCLCCARQRSPCRP